MLFSHDVDMYCTSTSTWNQQRISWCEHLCTCIRPTLHLPFRITSTYSILSICVKSTLLSKKGLVAIILFLPKERRSFHHPLILNSDSNCDTCLLNRAGHSLFISRFALRSPLISYPWIAIALALIWPIFRFAHHSIALKKPSGLLSEKSAKTQNRS